MHLHICTLMMTSKADQFCAVQEEHTIQIRVPLPASSLVLLLSADLVSSLLGSFVDSLVGSGLPKFLLGLLGANGLPGGAVEA